VATNTDYPGAVARIRVGYPDWADRAGYAVYNIFLLLFQLVIYNSVMQARTARGSRLRPGMAAEKM
jgi:hypothetical protein